jgi:type II secretory pathway component PulF
MATDSLFSKIGYNLRRFRFGGKAQLAFLEDLYVLINDGIPPNRAIEMMAQVTTGVTQEVARAISQKISEGQQLADGMRGWFHINVIEIIRVGEEGGALAETMKSAIHTLGQSSSSMAAFITALIYPVAVIIMAAAVIIYLNTSVFTQFASIKPMEQWPDAGRQLVEIANLIQRWWWALIVVIVLLILFIRKVLTNYVGELRPILDQFPPFSIYRRLSAARVMETLGLLVANGVVLKSAIRVMQYQANPYISSHLAMMEHLLSMGKGNVADVLSTGLISQQDILRLRVLAEVKGFELGLVRMGVHGSEQTAKTLKFISKVFGGILLGIAGLLIIIILRGIFMTGMSLGSV